jgi:hypothetical protein
MISAQKNGGKQTTNSFHFKKIILGVRIYPILQYGLHTHSSQHAIKPLASNCCAGRNIRYGGAYETITPGYNSTLQQT